MTVELDILALLPVLGPVAGALAVLVADLVAPRQRRAHYVIAVVSITVLGFPGLLGVIGAGAGDSKRTMCLSEYLCLYEVDAVSATLQFAALLSALAVLLIAWPRERHTPAEMSSTQIVLMLSATSGAVAVAGARDLGSWLVALEIATIPVIVLAALPATRAALAGAMQLLTTSLVSVALLVVGAGLWYAATGSPLLRAEAVLNVDTDAQRALLTLAVVFMLAGLAFKLSLAPFHAWTPTAYVGAPLAVTVLLATVSKIAALAALIVVAQALSALGAAAVATIAVLAAASMTLGNLVALRQRDVVRFLAWSTIAQAGWVVLPLVSLSGPGIQAAAGYLLGYVMATVVAFGVVAVLVREASEGATDGERSAYDISRFRGLLRRRPATAGAFALALFSLAGVPPGLLGLVTKILVLRPVLAEGWWVLGVIAVVNVVIGVAVYLRWFAVMLEAAPDELEPDRAHPSQALALLVSGVLLLVVGVAPQLMLGLLG